MLFIFSKLTGAPKAAAKYYRKTKDKQEKELLIDLYKAYFGFVKDAEIFAKYERKNGEHKFNDFNYEKKFVLNAAYKKLCKYGKEQGYADFYVSLFNEVQ